MKEQASRDERITRPASGVDRRQFVGGMLALAAAPLAGPLSAAAAEAAAQPAPKRAEFKRTIKLGVIGNGGRGGWIAKLFQEHGGYEMFAVADYFPDVANQCGDALGVDRARRFSTLSGYQRLLECGVEAVAVETPPFFIPEHACAAAEAGLHVYMAKPVAVDVPGARRVAETAKRAAARSRVFFVDYQMPTDPVNQEVAARIRDGGLGQIVQVQTVGISGVFRDPPKTENLESRLQKLIWVNDIAMGCDYLGNFDIHAIDAALWVLGRRPIVATGSSQIARPDAHGDSHGVCSVIYEYADGLVHNHYGQALPNKNTDTLAAMFHGTEANATVNYWGKAFLRGGPKHFGGGSVENLYRDGAVRNIASFYRAVTEGDFSIASAERAVDGVLTCILGREAGARHTRLTMDEVLRENRRLDVDLRGLKT